MVSHNLRRRKNSSRQLFLGNIDKKLLFVTLILVVLGLIAIADASAPQALNVFNDKYYYIKQQIVWAVAGVAALFVVSKINYKFWKKISIVFFGLSVVLLVVVLIPGIGTKVYGARRWLIFGPISIQPSELVKLTLAFFMAYLLENRDKILRSFIPVVLVSVLIMLEPDLGTNIIVLVIGLSQIFVSGIKISYFIGSLVVGALSGLALIFTSEYRRNRLLTFFKVSQDPLGKDYHIRQILLALGSGGLFGRGLGQSLQKYLFLPEAATDSIFAVIVEEVGFVGGLVIIGLFIYLIYRGIRIAKNAPDDFSRILATGIIIWISSQTLLNMGSIVSLVPLTGIPLPFFSYGGSALCMILISIGILLNISRFSKQSGSLLKRK